MDALSVLRDFTTRNEIDKITQHNNTFHFSSDYSFPCTTETSFRSKQGNLYTLQTLLFFIRHHNLKHSEYIQSARLNRIPVVTLPDRKPLLDYLQGKIASSESIELLPVDEYRPEPIQVEPEPPVDYVSLLRVKERPLKDRESLLECRNRDFYAVLMGSTRREEERHRIESQQRKDGLVAKTRLIGSDERGDDGVGYESTPRAKMHLKGSKIGEGVPIILVPSASQTLITIYNVKEFLEDGVFVASELKVRGMRGGAKPECVTVQKKLSRDRAVAAYEVRDKPSGFKIEDWERVVAVFVLGKDWQFKDWPFKDHVEIFNKIIGFYVRFEDDSVESAKIVKQWNVKIISISKNKRHQDRAAALEVWDRLEEFVRSRSHS